MKSNLYVKKVNKVLGFSLIELLIAIALSSIVTIVVVQLFTQTKSSYVVQESTTRMLENGRYAIQLLTKAIRSADFWGCIPTFEQEGKLPNWPPSGVQSIVNNLPITSIPGGVTGTENINAPGPAGSATQPDTLTVSGVIRGASFPLFSDLTNPVDPIVISLGPATASNIQPNEIMVIANCTHAEIFQATNNVDATATTGNDPNTATIQHDIVPFPTPTPYNNLKADFNNTYRASDSVVYRGTSTNVSYFIDPNFDHDGDGGLTTPAVPTLMRSIDGVPNPEALVPGVENLQLVFGEDTDTPLDGQADRYVTANNVANFANVVSVRITLVVRSPDATNNSAANYTIEGVQIDGTTIPAEANGLFHSRKVYTTTVTVRNRMS